MANKNKNLSLRFTEKQTTNFISHYKKLETHLKNMVEKTPLAVDAAITGLEKGVTGTLFSFGLRAIAVGVCSVFPVPEPFKVTRGTVCFIKPTDIGVVIGVDAGIRHLMKGLQGKEDVQTRMVAGLGSGAMFAIVQRQPPVDIIMNAVLFALANAAIFKAKEKYKSSRC